MADPRDKNRDRQDHDSQYDRRPVSTLCFKIVHDDYSFCFERAFIRSATRAGSRPIAAAVARTCFAKLSTLTFCARAPMAGGGSGTQLPPPITPVLAPIRPRS